MFKLQEAMRRTTPLARIQNADLISGARALSPEALAKVVYFSASVFWRAAVHAWRIEHHPLVKIDLRMYEEEFRLYLLGEAQFPNDAAMWCHVSPAEIPLGGVIFPHLKSKGTCHQFRFAIPGVAFDLFVGQTIPAKIRQTCVHHSADHVIFLSDVADVILVSSVKALDRPGGLSYRLTRAEEPFALTDGQRLMPPLTVVDAIGGDT